jgi:hypothetical protein
MAMSAPAIASMRVHRDFASTVLIAISSLGWNVQLGFACEGIIEVGISC